MILHSKEQYMQWVGSPLPLYSFPLKLNLVCQYILQSGEFCTCLHSAGILGKLTGCNNQVVTGVDSWPGIVCARSYSETQHFTSRRVPGSCCFSILEFSGGLTALSRAVGGPCGKNQPTASHTHSGLCVPSPSLLLLGPITLSGQLFSVFGICFHAQYALANSRFTWEWHRVWVLPLHYSRGWDHTGFAE